MSFLHFDKVTYHNFGPFAHETLDLDYGGLTVVEGKIIGKKGCDSNGAGKSFLFDGISWCLFGRCIRDKYTGDDVIKLDVKKDCWVSVLLRSEAGDTEIAITRYRKHAEHGSNVILVVNGKNESLGTSAPTTTRIEQLIGLDFTSFCNSVAFGVREDVRSFFAATDTERKKTLEKLLNLEVYTEAGKVSAKHLSEIVADITAHEHEQATAQSALNEQRSFRSQFMSDEEVVEAQLKLSVRRLTFKRLGQKIERQKLVVAKVKNECDAETAKYDEMIAHYRKDKATYDGLVAITQRDLRKHERAIGEAQGDKNVSEAFLKKLLKLKGKACPTCQQEVSEKTCVKIESEHSLVVKQAQEKIDTLMQAQNALKAELDKLVEPVYPEGTPDYENISYLLRDEEVQLDNLKRLQGIEEAHIVSAMKSQEDLGKRAATLDVQIEKNEKRLGEIVVELQSLHEQADLLGFWVEAFSNQGLKSFLIEAELPQINKRATEYAQLLLGEGATVRLSATSKLKTKDYTREKLDVEGSIPDCTESYAGASKGQRKRMDLSLLLAFRSIVSERQAKSIRQMFADELFDGMDKTGAETVTALLRDVSDDCPVMLVTHDERIKPIADRLITVVHVGKTASLKL